ncbi:MAG: hypothetical protein AABY22_05635 [Nanoarchaeota archaeon]
MNDPFIKLEIEMQKEKLYLALAGKHLILAQYTYLMERVQSAWKDKNYPRLIKDVKQAIRENNELEKEIRGRYGEVNYDKI